MPESVDVYMRVRACSLADAACNSYGPYLTSFVVLWFHHIFRHYLTTARFSKKKKKVIEHEMYVLIFFTPFV